MITVSYFLLLQVIYAGDDHILGGFSSNPDNKDFCQEVMAKLSKKYNAPSLLESFSVTGCETQVVAGINYRIKGTYMQPTSGGSQSAKPFPCTFIIYEDLEDNVELTSADGHEKCLALLSAKKDY